MVKNNVTQINKGSQFDRWLQAQGVTFSGIELFQHNGVRGVQATRTIAKGTLLAQIPIKACFYINEDDQNTYAKILGDYNHLYNYMPLLLKLMQEASDPNSIWRPYLDYLPSHFNNSPAAFGAIDQRLIKSSAAWQCLHECIGEYREEWRHLARISCELHHFEEAAFLWAREIYYSRAFRGDCFGWEDERCLIPLIDMCNHAEASNLELRYESKHDAFQAFSKQDIKPGDEILFYYGSHSNAYFITYYGFTIPENPIKTLRLPFKTFLEKQPLPNDAKPDELEKMPTWETTLTSDDPDTFLALLAKLRAWITHGSEGLSLPLKNFYEKLSYPKESLIGLALLELCDMRLKNMPNNLSNQPLRVTKKGGQAINLDNHNNIINIYNDEKRLLKILRDFASRLHQLSIKGNEHSDDNIFLYWYQNR